MSSKILFQRMRGSAFFVVGLVTVLFILLVTLASPFLVTYDPVANALPDKFMAPEWFANGLEGHVLGTDQLGRDVFTRLLVGGQYSLMIAAITVTIQVVVGSSLGILSGYVGKTVDAVIMRACDVMLSLPALILAIAIMAVLGANTFNLILVMSITGWVPFCKITRNNVIVVKNKEFVHASRVLGGNGLHIMSRQIFPNVTTHIIILASQQFGWAILTESSLSFLNLGIPAPTPSWGNMIAAGRSYLTICPWMALAPGIALMLVVLGFNFLGDGLRDVLDPKRN